MVGLIKAADKDVPEKFYRLFLQNYNWCQQAGIQSFVGSRFVAKLHSLENKKASSRWSQNSCPPPGDLPNPGIEPTVPALQVGKSRNTGVGSLSLL